MFFPLGKLSVASLPQLRHGRLAILRLAAFVLALHRCHWGYGSAEPLVSSFACWPPALPARNIHRTSSGLISMSNVIVQQAAPPTSGNGCAGAGFETSRRTDADQPMHAAFRSLGSRTPHAPSISIVTLFDPASSPSVRSVSSAL